MDDAESFSEIKQECEEEEDFVEYEEDLLEIVDNLKQEAVCFSSKEYNHENFVSVSDDAEATDISIKQECKEEDPLNIADDFVQTTETSEYTGTLSTNIAKVYIKTLSINTFVLSVKNNSLLI